MAPKLANIEKAEMSVVPKFSDIWCRKSRTKPNKFHAGAETAIPALIVAKVTGKRWWDYVEENIFRCCGMTGSAVYTRPQSLTDERIAHPYMVQADGSRVDAVRNLDKGSSHKYMADRNPGRAFIDAMGDGGFATAPDLVRSSAGCATARCWTGPGPTYSPQPRSRTQVRRSARTGLRPTSSAASG